MERNRGPSPRRDDPHEYRIGRLKHERVKVPRGIKILDWAMQVMKGHAGRKSILEVRADVHTASVSSAWSMLNSFFLRQIFRWSSRMKKVPV